MTVEVVPQTGRVRSDFCDPAIADDQICVVDEPLRQNRGDVPDHVVGEGLAGGGPSGHGGTALCT
ncbi:Uncharacterised protein [Mycobacteroides abscessus subsp. abscessus]|nr:Uncharacterised protein [Mycobacteroides abscessus subsp. abscessus]